MVYFGWIPRNAQKPSISNGFPMVSGGARELLDCFRITFGSASGLFCNDLFVSLEYVWMSLDLIYVQM